MSLLSRIRQFFAPSPPPASAALPVRREYRERSVLCMGPHGLHRMVYGEWGDPHNPRVLMCVHGLTRNGRDFDDLARALAGEYRVICPDVVGRGRSDWLENKDDYGFPVYMADMITLLARLDVDSVDWLGTSMGGLIGMLIASHPHSPITRLVLNDVGPVITASSLRRIGQYVGNAPRFSSMDEAEAYMRKVSAPFGPLTDAQWRHLTEHAVRAAADGRYTMTYDPGIGDSFHLVPVLLDVDLWKVYDAIRCPTLAIRGAQSDLLEASTLQAMRERGPRARVVEIEGVGHAPVLMDDAQIALVRDFLLAGGER